MPRRCLPYSRRKSLGVDFEKGRTVKMNLDRIAAIFDECKIAELVYEHTVYHGNSLGGTSREIVGAAVGTGVPRLRRPHWAAQGTCTVGLAL